MNSPNFTLTVTAFLVSSAKPESAIEEVYNVFARYANSISIEATKDPEPPQPQRFRKVGGEKARRV